MKKHVALIVAMILASILTAAGMAVLSEVLMRAPRPPTILSRPAPVTPN